MNLLITLNLTELSPAGAEGKVAQLKELIIKFSHMIFNSLYDITSNKYFRCQTDNLQIYIATWS